MTVLLVADHRDREEADVLAEALRARGLAVLVVDGVAVKSAQTRCPTFFDLVARSVREAGRARG